MARTSLERALIVFVFLLLVAIIVLAIFVALLFPSRHKDVPDVCLTEACIIAASTVLKGLDQTVEPCDDFYTYACGGWIRENPLLPGELVHGALYDNPKKNKLHLKTVLESSESDDVTLSDAERKARTFYASCTDTGVIDLLGSRPLLGLINFVGGWKLIKNRTELELWNWDSWNFPDSLARVHSLLEKAPLFLIAVQKSVLKNSEHPMQNVLWAQPSGLTLENPRYYSNRSITKDKGTLSLVQYMVDVSVLLGAEDNEATRNAMTKVLQFEQKLANITDAQIVIPEHFLTVAQLQETSSFIDWEKYFRNRFLGTPHKVTPGDSVTLIQKEYFVRLSRLVKQMLGSPDDLEVLHNYLMWHLVYNYATYLSKPFKAAFQKLLKAHGATEDPLSLSCAEETDKRLSLATGALFVREKLTPENKRSVESMVRYITASFKENVPKFTWIDEKTLKAAIDKVDSCEDVIGYPDYIKNLTFMNTVYREMTIREDSYFENVVSIVKFKTRENLMMLRTTELPDSLKSGDYSLTQVNAGYAVTLNRLMVPAGFIQAPYFTGDFPTSLNFGGIGTIIGHELTHGFDTDGRKFDKNGILFDWWSDSALENFEKQAECFVNQYSNYSVDEMRVQGQQTVGENIADNGGLETSFKAYLNWKNDHEPEPLLPAVHFTHEQLFFVAFAQAWCANPSPVYIANQILADVHSPDKIRILGSLSNSKAFSEHFKCRPGQPMNPVHKCIIW